MTKEFLIEQVYLHPTISGGKPSPDIDIKRADIESLLSAAINYAITKWTREQAREEMIAMRMFGVPYVGKPAQEFLTTLKLPVLEDATRGRNYIALPVGLQTLPNNAGLDDVFPCQGEAVYVKIRSFKEIKGIGSLGTTFYWFEKTETQEQRIYFENLGLPVCDHYVKMLVAVGDLNDTDIIPLPAGLEFEVVNLMVEFFSGQSKAELIADDKQDK